MRGWMAAGMVAILAAAAAAGEPRGPIFGNNAYLGEIRGEGAPDEDDFVGPLQAGERLSVEVAAAKGGVLLPSLAVLDPAGADRTPPLRSDPSGRRMSIPSLVADRTGRWVVRISGRDGSEGGYLVRFRVRPARPAVLRRRFEAAPEPRVESIPFEGLRGGRLSLRLAPVTAGGLPPLLEVLDPAGAAHSLEGALTDRRGEAFLVREFPLDGPDGTWRLLAGVEDGPIEVAIRADPPERRRGTAALDPREPHLDPRESPLAAVAGGIVRLEGAGFSRFPHPVVLVGGERATVLGAGIHGETLDVLLPPLPRGVPLPAAVVNPDGQACEEPDLVLVLPPGPAAAMTFLPESLRLEAGSTATVTVLLSGLAPAGGATVLLDADPGIGTVPPSIPVPPYAFQASFAFRAGEGEAKGWLRATLGNAIALPVTVVATPAPGVPVFDLSGWRLVQTDAARSWTLPGGTRIPAGGALVVSRNSSRTAFESFWRTALGASVSFLDSGDRFPVLNGDETLSLFAADGTLVDGPTIRLETGRAFRRVPGGPAGEDASWESSAATPGSFTPGAPASTGAAPAGIFLSAFADPSGPGQYPYECVEIRWDGSGL